MAEAKNKPGIHLYFSHESGDKKWYWHITASNGRIIARSSETYSRKGNAVKSIKIAAEIFRYKHPCSYFDHSKKDSPIQSYL